MGGGAERDAVQKVYVIKKRGVGEGGRIGKWSGRADVRDSISLSDTIRELHSTLIYNSSYFTEIASPLASFALHFLLGSALFASFLRRSFHAAIASLFAKVRKTRAHATRGPTSRGAPTKGRATNGRVRATGRPKVVVARPWPVRTNSVHPWDSIGRQPIGRATTRTRRR